MAEFEKRRARKWSQYLAALIANLGALSIGTQLGWTSQAWPKIAANETGVIMNESELSWMAGSMPLGAAFAAIPIPFLVDRIGRKKTLLSVVIPYVLGFGLLAWSFNADMYYAGRFISGASGGAFSIVTPVYTAEVGEKHIRGALGTYYEFMLAVGVEFSYIVGGSVSVFWLCIICGIIPIVFAILFSFMPESPYFYISKGKNEEAQKALRWLRGPGFDISGELKEIEDYYSESKEKKMSLEAFTTKAAKKSIAIAFGLMVFQQFGGANAVVFNTTRIFQAAGSQMEPRSATMIVGVMQFAGNFLSTLLVDRLGRRVLLLSSGLLMGACTLILGVYFHMLNSQQDVSHINWLPLFCLCVFMIMFSVGWGPVAWMMLGELFPTQIKGACSSFSCFVNWIATFLVTKFFPDMISAFGEDVTFWIFTVISAIGVVFIYFAVPETKGKSLEEIQRELSGYDNDGFEKRSCSSEEKVTHF